MLMKTQKMITILLSSVFDFCHEKTMVKYWKKKINVSSV